jgi:tetratricopeptide (TPR) repeat protein
MTVASQDSFGAPRYATVSPWRRLWQVPLLLAGLALFVWGVRALVHTIRPVPFAQQAEGIESLLAAERYSPAIDEINRLAPHYAKPLEQGRLQALAGDALVLSQAAAGNPARVNYEHAVEHYSKAVALGIAPDGAMNQRWGEAALALGQPQVAIEKLEAAIAASGNDTKLIQRHGRALVAAYLEAGQGGKAMALVGQLLAAAAEPGQDELQAMEERTWGLCQRIEIALNGGADERAALTQVVEEARAAIPTLQERDPGGRVLVWIARAELDQGLVDAAQHDLTEARARFAVHHIDDGRAAVLLARIAEIHGDFSQAAGLYQEVVTGHAGTSLWAAARLGRAQVAVRRGNYGGEQVVGDYQLALAEVLDQQVAVGKRPELISKATVRQSLLESFQRSSNAGKHPEALTFLAMAQRLDETPAAENLYRRAVTRELLGRELLAAGANQEPSDKAQQAAAARAMLADAAQDYLAHSRMSTLNDEQAGASLWKAAELLDLAGQTLPAVAVYEQLTTLRPRDPKVPEGLLALGRLYESAGMLAQAMAAYQRNLMENPKTPAAYTSTVNLARCYGLLAGRAGKPQDKAADLDKAEQLLLGLVQSADLQPAAREFRDSLLALGDLYYANGRWSDAILRLDEVVTRYPNDPAVPRVLFLLGESYRKSAADIGEALKDPATTKRAELDRARGERLLAAAQDYARVIDLLDAQAHSDAGATAAAKLSPLEEQYVRSAYLNRAGCYYLRGEYEHAIKLYDEVSARFSEEALAAQAYVQIVNAYLALKQPAQAAAAAERGRWILKRIPDAAFTTGAQPQSRQEFEKLLALSKN